MIPFLERYTPVLEAENGMQLFAPTAAGALLVTAAPSGVPQGTVAAWLTGGTGPLNYHFGGDVGPAGPTGLYLPVAGILVVENREQLDALWVQSNFQVKVQFFRGFTGTTI